MKKIPPPPEKPTADECCGSGCTPCIFDYYDRALSEWTEKYGGTKTPQQSSAHKRAGKNLNSTNVSPKTKP